MDDRRVGTVTCSGCFIATDCSCRKIDAIIEHVREKAETPAAVYLLETSPAGSGLFRCICHAEWTHTYSPIPPGGLNIGDCWSLILRRSRAHAESCGSMILKDSGRELLRVRWVTRQNGNL